MEELKREAGISHYNRWDDFRSRRVDTLAAFTHARALSKKARHWNINLKTL